MITFDPTVQLSSTVLTDNSFLTIKLSLHVWLHA